MKKALILLVLSLAFGLAAQAQQKSLLVHQRYDLNNYDGLRSEGPVPADLRLSLYELYGLDKQRVRDYNDGHLTNRDKVLAASYNINKLMASGRILFGDPITRMVERIADTLLKDYPTLRKELRFYTVKSPEVNAFATGQGMIFVNTGLVAQVKDEAQLAYVISHEIIHYYRNHTTEMLVRKKDKSSRFDDVDKELRDFIKRHNRSKEMENEADSLGLALFYIGSPYDKRVTDGVFDVLQYGYLPFDEIAFDTNFFNTPYFKLPQDYFLEELAPITARDDYNDSLSTHPNLLKRRTKTSKQLKSYEGGEHFVTLTQPEFEQIRTLARFECIRLDLVYSEFARAFYDCYLLLRQYPDNQFLQRAMGQALYGIAKNKAYTSTNNVIGDFNRMEGEVQQVYYLLRRLKADEMALVTAHYLYKTLQRFPDDRQLAAMTEDIFADLGGKLELKRDLFLKKMDTITAAPDTANAAKGSKYSRLKAKKKLQSHQDIRAYAFIDLFEQYPGFGQYLDDALAGRNRQYAKSSGNRRNQFVYSPSYFVVDKPSSLIDYKGSYNHEEELVKHIETIGNRFGYGTVDFSDQSLSKMVNAYQYNQFVTLNEWVGEFMQTKGNFPMHFLMQPQMDALMQQYDASVVNLSTGLNIEGAKFDPKPLTAFYLFPAAPFLFYKMFANNEITALNTLLVDAQSGQPLAERAIATMLSDSPSLLKSELYETYTHIDTLRRDAESVKYPTPGYLGRRLAISVDAMVSPTFNRHTLYSSTEANIFDYITLSPTFGLEFAINENTSLTARFNRKSTSNRFAYPHSMNTYAFGVRTYGKGTNAPLGPYMDYALTYSHLLYPESSSAATEYGLSAEETKTSAFGLQVSCGRNYIFSDRFLFNLSCSYTFTAFNIANYLWSDTPSPQADIMISNILMVGIGIGLLPF